MLRYINNNPRFLLCTGFLIQSETGVGKALCLVVEQYGYVSKAEIKIMLVISSAITDATFDLLGIHVTNSLHANAPATK